MSVISFKSPLVLNHDPTHRNNRVLTIIIRNFSKMKISYKEDNQHSMQYLHIGGVCPKQIPRSEGGDVLKAIIISINNYKQKTFICITRGTQILLPGHWSGNYR